MDRYKNRDQEIAPTDIGYRDFVVSCWISWWVVSCGSGLLTAIWVNEIDSQETAPTGRFYSTSHDRICQLHRL